MRSELARRLQAARIEAGFDNTDALAPLIGKTARQLRNYESGKTETVPSDVLRRWAAATGKPLEYFLPPERKVDNENGPPKIVHRGVEELAADPELVARLGLTMQAVEAARHFVALGNDGQPVEIDNLTDAVEIVRVLQRTLQRRGAGGG